MTTQEIINSISQEARDLEAELESHPYAPTENDYIEQEQIRIYTDEYLEKMPSDYTGLLSRYGALIEVKSLLKDSSDKSESFLNSTNSRFQITFDE